MVLFNITNPELAIIVSAGFLKNIETCCEFKNYLY